MLGCSVCDKVVREATGDKREDISTGVLRTCVPAALGRDGVPLGGIGQDPLISLAAAAGLEFFARGTGKRVLNEMRVCACSERIRKAAE